MSSSRRKVPVGISNFKSRRDRKRDLARQRKHDAHCKLTRQGSTDIEHTCPLKDVKDPKEQRNIIERCALAAGVKLEDIPISIEAYGVVCHRTWNVPVVDEQFDRVDGAVFTESENQGGW